MFWQRLLRFRSTFCAPGILLGTLLFAVSLTPSLLPRPFAHQVVLSGVALAVGYGLGVFGRWIWYSMGLPSMPSRAGLFAKRSLAVISMLLVVVFLARAKVWQDSIRELLGMDAAPGTQPIMLGVLAMLLFVLIIALARLFRQIARRLTVWLDRFVPRKISRVVGAAGATILFWLMVEGIAIRVVLNVFETSFRQLDALVESDLEAPRSPALSGSPASLVDWRDLGRRGRDFVGSVSTSAALSAFFENETAEPVRVYVGLNAAGTIAERAELALAELIRAGGFEREVLVVVTPTGTGWVDPGSINSIEYLHRGDVASVAIQYSYLPSWLTLITRPEYGVETARHLFQAVYGHWITLDPAQRPRLYLNGLSLGALNSQRSLDIWDIVGDPIDGALWSGPPFRSDTWRWVTEHRDGGSPAWLPKFRDGRVIRFTNQHNTLPPVEEEWGPLRIVFLQYASDPIVFFEPASFYREPQWMMEPRGPDVSKHLSWYPVVTFLQLAADIFGAEGAPIGYGHSYATEHYIAAWLAVSCPEGWNEEEIGRLKRTIGDLND